VEVQLPRAEARPITAAEGVVVSLDAEGRIFVDETAVSFQDFALTFRSIVQSRHPRSVYLRADRRVPYGDVVRVLAVIRTSGVINVGLVAEQEGEQ
jgi:biopolymer transport protein ExbD